MRPSRRQTQLFPRYWPAGHPSVTVLLVAGLVGIFAAQWIVETVQPELFVEPHWPRTLLGLTGDSFSNGQWWQFFTFGLLHTGPLHLLGNLLLLYFAGREVEPIFGRKQTFTLFLAGQILGGVVHAFAMPDLRLLGVSGGAAALVAAFATTLPELEVVGHLFFVVPLKVCAKFFGLGLALVSALCWFTQSIPAIGPAAAFTGCLVGWLHTRRLGFGRPFWIQRIVFERRRREARLDRMPAAQFVAQEIDPILEKIACTGMASLSRTERKMLERARAKISGPATPRA